MLTPKEVSERVFTRASFGGYNMTMVDEFLDVLTEDYTALYNENALLKSKMKVLVDKVEEYRSTEEAVRKAFVSAQRMADQLVQEAQDKKESILREAERNANDQIVQIRRQIEAEQARLVAAQQATANYVQQACQLQEKAREYLDRLGEMTPEVQSDIISREEETVQEIEDSVQRILQAQMAAAQREEEVEEPTTDLNLDQTTDFASDREPSLFDEVEDEDRTKVIHRDFGALEFGKDYEIK